MMRNLLRTFIHALLPRKISPRRIRFGLAKGAMVNIDFRYDTAFYFGRHEADLHQYYRRLLKPGMRCFDAGMYRGWDALLMAHLTGSEVVSFDGNPDCLELATGFLAPSKSKIRLENAYLTDGSDGRPTLDEAAENYFMPDFIKIDVEGAEAMVLGGAGHILAQRMPSLVVEIHGSEVEALCMARLKEYGYSPITVNRSRGPLTESRSMSHNRWLVCEGRSVA